MSDLVSRRGRRPWAALFEERFTNCDVVVLAVALVVTGFIGALSGVNLIAG